MKKLIYISIFAFLLAGTSALTAQDWPEEYLGLPGDNLNLYAVMTLFQNSETLESFERSLNDPDLMINNLDLNGDNLVDYIMVFDYAEGDIHNIVLRVALNQHEHQDVAVFAIQKFSNGSVLVQLIGDETLYGPNYIIEPVYAETPNPGYRGNVNHQNASSYQYASVVSTTYYEVADWPVIIYICRPNYRPWRSAWYWGYYPGYWNPWSPHYWHYYYGYHYNWNTYYYTYYRPCRYHRGDRYHKYYYGRVRTSSPTVVININSGRYRNTYSRPDKKGDGLMHYAHRHPNGNLDAIKGRPGSTQDRRKPTEKKPDANANVNVSSNIVSSRPTRYDRQNSNNTTGQVDRVSRDDNQANSGNRETNLGAKRPSTQSTGSTITPSKPAGLPSGNQTTTRPSRESINTTQRNPAQTVTRPSRERTTPPATSVDRSSSERNRPSSAITPSVTSKERTPSSGERVQPQSSTKSPASNVGSSNQSSQRSNTGTASKGNESSNRESGRKESSGGSSSQKR